MVAIAPVSIAIIMARWGAVVSIAPIVTLPVSSSAVVAISVVPGMTAVTAVCTAIVVAGRNPISIVVVVVVVVVSVVRATVVVAASDGESDLRRGGS